YIEQGFDLSIGESTHAITHFIDAIQPPIPTDFITTVQECGAVYVDINPCWTGYNVNWNFGDGFGTSSSASTSYVYSNSGTFTITLTVSLGVCSQTFTQQVTVNTCCTAPTTIPVAGANSSAYGSGFSGTTIAINGDFIIDNNFVINNKTVLMAPNTKIIILPGKTLNISKSELYSCGTDMWDGIEIRPGGRLILQNKSVIEDAKIAVLSDNNGGIANFIIRNSTFNRNYIGIKVQQHQTGTPHPGTIQSTTFDSRPSTTTTTNTRQLDAPYQNQTAETGIELSSVNSFVVGSVSSPTAKNTFKYLLKGIHALNSVYTVYNNEFSDNAQKGWAIYNYKGVKTIVGGSGNNQPNLFKNLWNGISHVSSSDLLVENNTFNNINEQIPFSLISSSVAIYTFECNNASIQLSKNQLNTVATGFKHFKNDKATYKAIDNVFSTFTNQAISCIENRYGNIDVRTNNFTGGANPLYLSNTAVYVAGTGNTFLTSSVVKIYDNTISRINKGIHVINIGRPEIYRNAINFAANISPLINEWYKGVQTQNCAREEIHNNTIDKTGSNPSAAVVNALYGISLETSSNPAVSENTVKKMGNGFRFRGFYDEADFRCNTMTNNWFGLTIDNAKIGDQGEAPSAAHPNGLAGDNTWTDPTIIGSTTAVKGLGTIYPAAFYTRSAGYNFTPEPFHQSPLNVILTGSTSFPLITFLTTADQNCQTICYDPTTCKIRRLAKIARNENPFDQVLGNQRFMMQEAVLRGVISDSLVMDTTTQDGRDLQMFIDTLALTNVGKLVEVTTLFARGDTTLAEALNLSINPAACADAYHKIVNEIYFRTWAKNVFEFSPTDSTVLYDIAIQDPLVCGTAIYNARVMMNIDINDYSVDANGNRLMNTNDAAEKQVQQIVKGKLYPNPSQHTVNYEITLATEQVGVLVFYDLMGKEVLASQLTSGDNKLTLDVSKFKNGLYLYKVFVNGKPQETGKFIIQH
ncbi:MAG: T9SS type A sorting domain-containing protein, partial [Flavobacteriales bacterium]|nr:T9SS type A sorting domain-containing protein [Flavobacteriales bacterium]